MSRISETQLKTLRMMKENGGTIHRFDGGFWMRRGAESVQHPSMGYQSPKSGEFSVDIRTIRAMEKRGWVERTYEFKEEYRDTRRITDEGKAISFTI